MGKKPQAAENIKVLVRCRPLSEKEKGKGHKNCIDADMTACTVAVRPPNGEPVGYTFDAVITNTFTQKDIFTQYIQPMVDCVLDGFNATVFAYGQSGSGKTHTMTGVMGDAVLEGVTPRSVAHIFNSVKEMKTTSTNKAFSLEVTFVELYNGKVRDLLAKEQVSLDVREKPDHSFYVQGALSLPVQKPEDVYKLMEQGTDRRRVASTELNADSSRSHSIFTLSLKCVETTDNGDVPRSSKLNLVDLAGSERQGKTGATGETLAEGCNINLSLSALGTVIDTIVKGVGHVPFRSSQLTMLLKDSLGGNSKTVMFANINPSDRNFSETISTLRFADRAKQIKNKPVVNLDAKDQKISELADMVQQLKQKLQKFETGGVASLETELEELRDKESELQVALDNEVKGRQADAVDFDNAKAKFAADTQAFNTRMVEQEDQIAKLKNDLQIAEAKIADGNNQAHEILQICTTYLRPDKAFRDAEDLQHFLKELTSEGPLSATSRSKAEGEVQQLKSKIKALESETQTVKKEMKSKVKEMKERREEDKKSIHNAESKIKKLQTELDAVKEKAATDARLASEAVASAQAQAQNAVAAAAAVTAAPSPKGSDEKTNARSSSKSAPPPLTVEPTVIVKPEDLKVVQDAITSYEKKNIINTPEFKKADACLDDLQRAHREVQNGVGHELSSLKKHLGTRRTDGDQATVIQELQDLVHQSDKTIANLMAEIATSHQLLANMRSVMKKTVTVPLSVVKGDSKLAEESVEALTAIEEQANGVQSQLLEKISENLNLATTQRNRLLSVLCDGEGNLDVRQELSNLLLENQKLQEQKMEGIKEVSNQVNQNFAVATQQQLIDPVVSPAARPVTSTQEGRTPSRSGDGGQHTESSRKGGEESGRKRGGSHDAASRARIVALEAKKEKYKVELEAAKRQLHDLRSEIETMKVELAEERAARESQEAFKEKLYDELQKQREEISDSERKNAELESRMDEITQAYEQKLASNKHQETEVADLENRLHKRSEQLNQLRKLLDTQKTLIVRSNEKIDYYQQKLKETEQVIESTKAHYERLLSEKDDSVQRLINQRMEEYSEACKYETNEKLVEIKKLKKKVKKLQAGMGEMEEEFDKKVLECEELREVINEQKLQFLKEERRRKNPEREDINDHNDHIRTSLEKSKEERRQREDRFAMGEVENAKTTASRSALRSRGSDVSDGSW